MSKKHKVLLYIAEFLPPSQTFIQTYVNSLDRFCDVCIVSNHISRNDKHLKTVEIPYPKTKKWRSIRTYRNFYFDKKYSNALNEVIRVFEPDIIHCHFGDNLPKLLYNLERIFLSKVVCHYWGFDASSYLRIKYNQKLFHNIYSHFQVPSFFVSDALKRSFLNAVGCDIKDLYVMHHGIDPNVFKRSKQSRGEVLRFLQVSRLVEKKGIDISIRAFESLVKETGRTDLEYHIIGDGPLRQHLEELIGKMKSKNMIFLRGKISHQCIVKEYDLASYFLHHSITSNDGDMEGLPTTIMEAMAMELPVVVSDHSGISELVEDKVNGYVTKESDIEEYVIAMKQILMWGYKRKNATKVKAYFNVNKYPKEFITFVANTIIS